MSNLTATSIANANIALIKYWGNRDPKLRLPANGSISMNLEGLQARTSVTFDENLTNDEFTLNGERQSAASLARVSMHLEHVRRMAKIVLPARVESENNFPTGAGIASSAAAFAALSLAATSAARLTLDERALSRLARLGSGSACRSVPGGFVEWQAGTGDEDSYAYTIAPPDHWQLSDCIAVVSTTHKPVGSSAGHALADTSPLQTARVQDASRRLDLCRQAILRRDFSALASVLELDTHWMHAVMMTSQPPLLYWAPATLEIIHEVLVWRQVGLPVCYSMDAGANVHVLCPTTQAQEIASRLGKIPHVLEVLVASCGEGAKILN